MERRRATISGIVAVLVMAALTACGPAAPPPPKPPPAAPQARFEARTFAQLPGWAGDPLSEALTAFVRSCAALGRRQVPLQAATAVSASIRIAPAADNGAWAAACGEAQALAADDAAARAFFEKRFRVWQVTDNGAAEGLFTGYYEPTLRGCRTPRPGCRVPLYQPPPATSAPSPTRAEIEAGALAGRGLELLWLADPIDAFFLHIQGSGRVIFDDGTSVRVGYAGKNGHPYFAIGRELVRRGALAQPDVSMQSIRGWLAAHPAEAPAVMALNASYVFFQRNHRDGPVGSQGVVLTPERSLAVDPAHIPLGLPLFLDTSDPLAPELPLRRLVIAQDTGGAIKGVVRGDLFWGVGARAEAAAGMMKARGRLYVLLPAGVSP